MIVIIIIAGVAAYGYMSQNPADPETTSTPTASTSPSTEPSETTQPSETATSVTGANSMKYNVNIIENGHLQTSYTFMGKNIGTDDFSMVAQITDMDGETIYIFNGAQHKAWSYVQGEWEDISTVL